ncbi:fibronectin type III domain protein [Oesophagostomum dentatum]|uniref:Fibronectin type III domain protein n=1 Tax=Oesophagostomum dentatum TaxID=61180 RepID=A0A0B1TLP9_OESDE|nr:fibronectin type III domain protein [Oesophagostomum dentatum]
MFITRPPAELRVFEGAPAEVSCEGFGDPLPIVYWVHSEKRISSAVLSFPSVSHGDHGVYECIVSNAVSSISSRMNLIVDRTRPQSAVIDKVECVGEEAISINWTPGFNGSYPQSFIVHYVSDEDPSEKSLLTTLHSATIGDLKPFSKYRIHIESRNQKGSTNSSAVEKHVCSTLPSPANVRFTGDSELRWDPVEFARSYRVESRYDKMSAFEGIGEVFDPFLKLRPEFRPGRSFRVRSLRDPYDPSIPSKTITLGSSGYGPPSMWWAVFGGFLFFFLFLSLYLYSKYGKYINRRRRKNKHYNDYVCPASFQPHSETMYEASMNPTESTKSGRWEDSKESGSLMQHHSQELLDYCYAEESNSAVDDMLRDKYMYGAEDVPVQLMNDLRIERLRREYKQSQL